MKSVPLRTPKQIIANKTSQVWNQLNVYVPMCKQAIEKHQCPLCHNHIQPNAFKDPLSVKEYNVSSMCQQCQDAVYDENGSMSESPEI